MNDFKKNDDLPVLFLPYYPPKEDESLSLLKVSTYLLLSMDGELDLARLKKTAQEEINPDSKNAETKLKKQESAIAKLVYNKNTLEAAIKIAQKACELDPKNATYRDHLVYLKQMEI